MPPINQQGSRAGLITALVAFVILFVVSLVFAFNFYGQLKQQTINFDAYKKQYSGYLSDVAITSAPVQALVAAKQEQPPHFGITAGETAVDVAVKQTAGLSTLITGAPDQTPSAAADAAGAELRKDQQSLKQSGVDSDLTGGGLNGAINRLTGLVVSGRQTDAATARDRDAARAQVQALTTSIAAIQAKDAEAAKAQQQTAADAQAQLQKSADDAEATAKQVQADEQASVAKNAAAQQQAQTSVSDANRQLAQVQQQLDSTRAKLGNRRPDVTNSIVRQADGELIRVPGGGICYINLGYGTGVTNGLTFEVYDKLAGVPPIPPNVTGDEQLPVGKASIEIIHVGQNSSECRIVHTEPGAVLTEGDPIENLVYDAHQKYQFDVYGNFDLANTGRPNPADAEVVKRLVTQWGGKLTDKVSPDTDFLVLGAEPVLPEFAKDDLTPENQDKLQKAQDALDKYQEVRQQAVQLHIPIMNQNRFLYYVGYYDQAKR